MEQSIIGSRTFHMAMFPWFALGHLIPYLHFSNKLAQKGHKISFLIRSSTGSCKTQSKLASYNLHPESITFIPITVPSVTGLPPNAETTSDLPSSLYPLLMTAMDCTQNDVENLLLGLKVDVVFFDLAHWIPSVARQLGIKSLYYCIITPSAIGYTLSRARMLCGKELTVAEMMKPPEGYPFLTLKLQLHEGRVLAEKRTLKFGSNLLFYDRLYTTLSQCDALGFKACREIEGPYCDYLGSQYEKPVLLSGPFMAEPLTSYLEEKWATWLGGFEAGSVLYCALGTECFLTKDQFQELVIGLELTGMPFLAVLKPPVGAASIEEALPEMFEDRLQGRGIVHGGWVQQQLILEHRSAGCFITHCGPTSLSEGLVNNCQLVLPPQAPVQIINAKMMSLNLKVGVEIERGEEDGLFTRESVHKAVRTVMEEDSEIGKEVRANHAKLRELLLSKDLESSYVDSFNQKLEVLLGAYGEKV